VGGEILCNLFTAFSTKCNTTEMSYLPWREGRFFLIAFFLRSTYKTLETRGAWLRHKSWVGSGNESK
jgi:hypothetical protein